MSLLGVGGWGNFQPWPPLQLWFQLSDALGSMWSPFRPLRPPPSPLGPPLRPSFLPSPAPRQWAPVQVPRALPVSFLSLLPVRISSFATFLRPPHALSYSTEKAGPSGSDVLPSPLIPPHVSFQLSLIYNVVLVSAVHKVNPLYIYI